MTPQKSLYSNSDKEAEIKRLPYPDMGFLPAVDLYAPRETRNPELTEKEKEIFIAQAEAEAANSKD